jgi:hypothetical protein
MDTERFEEIQHDMLNRLIQNQQQWNQALGRTGGHPNFWAERYGCDTPEELVERRIEHGERTLRLAIEQDLVEFTDEHLVLVMYPGRFSEAVRRRALEHLVRIAAEHHLLEPA